MSPKQVTDKMFEQMFKQDKISGLDVTAWLFRHVGWFIMMGVVLTSMSSLVWQAKIKPAMICVAEKLDSVVTVKVNENTERSKDTYYMVKKIELIQKRTSPARVVKEASEEIEIEKWSDK